VTAYCAHHSREKRSSLTRVSRHTPNLNQATLSRRDEMND
jgi:hypothetical protein